MARPGIASPGRENEETVTTAVMTAEEPRAPESEEVALVAASRAGDEEAFTRLVRRHERRVFQLAGRFFHTREEVEDAAQETFLTVWSKLGTYRGRAPFEHWLTRVCLNCCYARLRRRRPAEVPLVREPAAPAAAPGSRLEAERLLARLTPEDRFVLTLLHGEQISVAEIADLTGWSRSKVKVRAHRARKRLRRLLEEAPA
ncbi:MAG: sigma-70 family RNA polymerase sigma factor [Thermoanaerobaculia bacterium]|nr:sigma-70 family RNA polymerase sigma factor [Thermoanaerobaculia bacterium]